MLDTLHVIGLNHRTAPVSLRGDLARRLGPVEDALDRLGKTVEECVIISTCNRLECYSRSDDPVDTLHAVCPDLSEELRGHLYRHQGADCVTHLVSVAASLDSLVIGETQILGQVREAYELARARGTVGTALHTVFQGALQAAKEVQTTTGLGQGHLSVASVALDVSHQVWESLQDRTVLLVGSGDIARAMAHALQDAGPVRLRVTSRTRDHAERFAQEFGAEAVDWDRWVDTLADCDICISAVDSPEVILDRERVMRGRGDQSHDPLLMIDLSVPQTISNDLDDLPGLYRYDMDALGEITAANTRERETEMQTGRDIIMRHVARLVTRLDRQDLSEVYRALDARGREILEAELDRLRGKVPEEHLDLIRESLNRYGNKLLHPVRSHAPGLIGDLESLEQLLLGKSAS